MTVSEEQLSIDELIEINVIGGTDDFPVVNRAGLIGSIRDAIEAASSIPSREAVAVAWTDKNDLGKTFFSVFGHRTALYDQALFTAPPSPTVAEARVKALVWEQPDGPDGTSWLAHGTDWCLFYIRRVGNEWVLEGPTDNPEDGTPFGTLDEAKAAAQADYEQRIRSALQSTQGGKS